ncbi:Na(+)-translocating NADH-quinone reductase subunit A [Paracrocinitomix mangrovi]|uniref:Na(+)-translocating NADH-quinone reductase subunit A n=1 Tax=Paracrocinitomix mangrovi TaxID=2862509 RepID=UPI001C8D78BD|nr:Na(+)-translocating NADH-quinone reductase subunit A [Paracrocinitomix mangrovi]UKN01372.1 Na(+)-translocating NADH-quinone reductase subunit A [Paracrocinitomix mangrovi]
MSKTIKLRKGLDIKLVGEADKVKATVERSDSFAIKPPDFHGLVPKMLVKVGDKVKAGTPIFEDKYNPDVNFVSPVAGEIEDVVRGAKRRILEIRIKADAENSFEDLGAVDTANMSGEEVKAYMLKNGLWPFIKMRPLDVIARPEDKPKAIFISGFDSSPLAPDYDFILHGENELFQRGLYALSKLTDGKIHLTLRGGSVADDTFTKAQGVQINKISGKHPIGNVGTQIHHIDPVNKGEVVWTVNAQDVALIGRVMSSGQFDASKVIAITGSEVKNPKYIKTTIGTKIDNIIADNIKEGNVRYISGNVLTGDKVDADGYLGFYHSQITVIPEGDEPKFMITQGWMSPGFNKFSINRSYFSWLTPNKKRVLDTNLNGEIRAFVVTGEMEKVFPFDIYPMQLIKSVMYNDIDLMENLGIYEVAPEDFALCEFVCTSKINIQSVIRDGLDVIQEECM